MLYSSESENEDMADLLEATDKNFLSDELFNVKFKSQTSNLLNLKSESYQKNIAPMNEHFITAVSKTHYCGESHIKTSTDITVVNEMQIYFTKKLTNLIRRETEFYQGSNTAHSEEMPQSKLMLLKGADCYVKPYEEFEYDTSGYRKKKPKIKRRNLSNEAELTVNEKINASTICHKQILSSYEVKAFANKPERSDRFFCYKAYNNKLIATI